MASEPIRTCIVCRKKGTKDNFVKIVKNKNNNFLILKDNYAEGRGAYVCNDKTCKENCLKTKPLNRAFKTNVPSEIYEELLND